MQKRCRRGRRIVFDTLGNTGYTEACKPMVSQEQLQEIIDRITDNYPVHTIVVFGSFARGDAHQHSDLNLCIVVTPGKEHAFEQWPSPTWLYRAAELIQQIAASEIVIDPYVFTETEFNTLRDGEHPFIAQILAEGRVVYEQ